MGNCCTRRRRYRSPELDRRRYSKRLSTTVQLPVPNVSIPSFDIDLPSYAEYSIEPTEPTSKAIISGIYSSGKSPHVGVGGPSLSSEDDQMWIPSTPYCSASFDVTNESTTIKWKGYGLKIQVLDDSIPRYLSMARLDVSVHVFNNRDRLPLSAGDRSNQHPISALYSIKVGRGKLCKPVTIEIQHCNSSLYIPELTLLRATNEREYFKPVKDAVFDRRTNYVRVTVPKLDFNESKEYDDFSWFVIALRRVLFPYTIHYKAHVYISKTTLKMHFVVMMAIDSCSTVVETKYEEYDLHSSFPVEFEDNRRISLDVPEEGKVLKSGWVITPLYDPSIKKQQVDRFCIFHNDIPKCEVSFRWCKQSPPVIFEHKITLTEGTANGKKHFHISFDPPHTSSIIPRNYSAPHTSTSISDSQQAGMPQGTSDSTVTVLGTGAAAGVLSSDLSAELTAQHTGKNTTEYLTIKECIPQLQTAFTHNLTELSSHLLSKGVITVDQDRKLRNSEHSESDRAAKLVDFVMNKVELASQYYIRFVKVLEEDKHTNELVLKLLEETHTHINNS